MRRRLVTLLGAAVPCLTAALPAPAADAVGGDSLAIAVKAAFVYKFQIYVTWPQTAFGSAGAPFNLCIIGAPAAGSLIERAVGGQSHGSHPIRVLHLRNLADDRGCHLAFIGSADQRFVGQQLAGAGAFPTLTVTDTEGPARGIINFVLVDDSVRFAIDQEMARRLALGISSKLLHLAVAAGDD